MDFLLVKCRDEFCRDGLARAKQGSMNADCRLFSIRSVKLSNRNSSHKTFGILVLLINHYYIFIDRNLGKFNCTLFYTLARWSDI